MAPSRWTGILLNALVLVSRANALVGQKVSSASIAGEPLFESEQFQLTDSDIAQLSKSEAALVAFGNGTDETAPSTDGCKVFPGDDQWPSESTWSTFDDLLDGALVKTVPLAASCYSSWPQYDDLKCEHISAQWNNSDIQSVAPHIET